LQEELDTRVPDVSFQIIDKSLPGITTTDIAKNLEHHIRTFSPDIVITMMGINDSLMYLRSPGRMKKKKRTFVGHLKTMKLMHLLAEHAKARYFSINDACADEMSRENDPDEYFYQADKYLAISNAVGAMRELDTALKIYPQKYIAAKENRVLYSNCALQLFQNDAFERSRTFIEAALRVMPDERQLSLHLGTCLYELGEYAEAQSVLEQLDRSVSDDEQLLQLLAAVYIARHLFTNARVILDEALILFPDSSTFLIQYGDLHAARNRDEEAERYYRAALSQQPLNAQVLLAFSKFLYCKERHEEVVALFDGFANDSSNQRRAKEFLVKSLMDLQRYDDAEKVFKELVQGENVNAEHYAGLALVLQLQGKEKDAKRYYAWARKARANFVSRETFENYNYVKEVVLKKGIHLICVQYPMRSVQLLKDLVLPPYDKILFVDNEHTFKNAVKADSYEVYFEDAFGSDFGHCTPTGNQLLAGTIADAIITEYLNRS